MESASADDVRARGSPKGLVLAPLQAQAQHYPKGEGWKRSQFGSRKRSQTDRQTDAQTDNDHFNRVWTSTTLLRNKIYYYLLLRYSFAESLSRGHTALVHRTVYMTHEHARPCNDVELFCMHYVDRYAYMYF